MASFPARGTVVLTSTAAGLGARGGRPPVSAVSAAGVSLVRGKLNDYLLLVKARLSLVVLASAVAGFWLASPATPNLELLALFAAGTFLIVSGANASNQVLERTYDAMMKRTASRPLPSGRMSVAEATLVAVALSLSGMVLLALSTAAVTVWLALIATLVYVFVYTPLKRRSPWATVAGAVSGAIPPLMGWTAAQGGFSASAWALFGILFFWQFPHTWAIASVHVEDYSRAGYCLLPRSKSGMRAIRVQVLTCSLAMVGASLLPTYLGLAGTSYFVGALILGGLFLGVAARFGRVPGRKAAVQLMAGTLLYLPLILTMLVLDRQGY